MGQSIIGNYSNNKISSYSPPVDGVEVFEQKYKQHFTKYLYLIINWEVVDSERGPLRRGPVSCGWIWSMGSLRVLLYEGLDMGGGFLVSGRRDQCQSGMN